jgi:flagellar motility protein MotE (MotC chaperone)
MAPKDAAKVLTQMSDADVQVILGYVGAKQAAAILAVLPPDRAANLSKSAMHTGTKGSAP